MEEQSMVLYDIKEQLESALLNEQDIKNKINALFTALKQLAKVYEYDTSLEGSMKGGVWRFYSPCQEKAMLVVEPYVNYVNEKSVVEFYTDTGKGFFVLDTFIEVFETVCLILKEQEVYFKYDAKDNLFKQEGKDDH